LHDDYVKFFKFAQWRIERTGYGILAFISNHGYLDNPTFRGMRRSLMHTFDDIFILNLHGNTKKREVAPDGGPDQNVFDIQQGVAIGLFVKRTRGSDKKTAVRYADLWGVREVVEEGIDGPMIVGGKYHWLWTADASTTQWEKIEPVAPFYTFIPQQTDIRDEYHGGADSVRSRISGAGGCHFVSTRIPGVQEDVQGRMLKGCEPHRRSSHPAILFALQFTPVAKNNPVSAGSQSRRATGLRHTPSLCRSSKLAVLAGD
jgi:hypothetical protein